MSDKDKKVRDQGCSVFDCTLSFKYCDKHTNLIKAFEPWFKKYSFQLEKGDGGYIHWQIRVSLIKRRRPDEFRKAMAGAGEPLCKGRWSVSSKNSLKGEAFYCTKADTRVDGPWKDTDPPPVFIPWQLEDITTLRPFQQQIVDDAKIEKRDKRTINFVHDVTGNNGKSMLVAWVRAHRIGRCLPAMNDYEDLLASVMDQPKAPLYIIDLPRALNQKKLGGLYAAIETIKDGYAYDKRYKFREEIFHAPNIWVIGNTIPAIDFLSQDRWKFWIINAKYEFENVTSKYVSKNAEIDQNDKS